MSTDRIKQLEARVAQAKKDVRATMSIAELSKESVRDIVSEVGETQAYLNTLFGRSDRELRGSTVSLRNEINKLVQEGTDADASRLKEIRERIKEISKVASEEGDVESEFLKEYGMAAASGMGRARKHKLRGDRSTSGKVYGEGLFSSIFGSSFTNWMVGDDKEKGSKRRRRADLKLSMAQSDLDASIGGSSDTPAEMEEQRREGEVRQKEIKKKENNVIDLLEEIRDNTKHLLGGMGLAGGFPGSSDGEQNASGGGPIAWIKENWDDVLLGTLGIGQLFSFRRGGRGRLPTGTRGPTTRTPGTSKPSSKPPPKANPNVKPTNPGKFNGHKYPQDFVDKKTGKVYDQRLNKGRGGWRAGSSNPANPGSTSTAPKKPPKPPPASAAGRATKGLTKTAGKTLAKAGPLGTIISGAMAVDTATGDLEAIASGQMELPEGRSVDEQMFLSLGAGFIGSLDMFGQAESAGFESNADLAEGVASLFGMSSHHLEIGRMEKQGKANKANFESLHRHLKKLAGGFDLNSEIGKRLFYTNQYLQLQAYKNAGIDEMMFWSHAENAYHWKTKTPMPIGKTEDLIINQLAYSIAQMEAEKQGLKSPNAGRVQEIAELLRRGQFRLPGDNRLGVDPNAPTLIPNQIGNGEMNQGILPSLLDSGFGGDALKPFLERGMGIDGSIQLQPVSMLPSQNNIPRAMKLDRNASALFNNTMFAGAGGAGGPDYALVNAPSMNVQNTTNYIADPYDESSLADGDRIAMMNDVNYNLRYS